MKLTFIYNSGFLLETGSANILFDYYRKGHDIIRRVLASPLPLYVLVSHSHPDHFNPDCLGWKSKHKEVHYIFSDELQSVIKGHDKEIVYLPVGGEYSDSLLTIEAFDCWFDMFVFAVVRFLGLGNGKLLDRIATLVCKMANEKRPLNILIKLFRLDYWKKCNWEGAIIVSTKS